MNNKTNENIPEENQPLDAEMVELKRDMRSAQVTAWLESNTQSLIAGVIVLVLVLIGGGLWIEHNKSQRSSAATVYQQALQEKDQAKKIALFESVSREFGGTSYAVLSEMELAAVDVDHAEKHLTAIIQAPASMEEWVWQARLDLAELKLAAKDKAAARTPLADPVGKQYEQLRQYLLAEASETDADKQMHLQKALDAPSLDNDLKRKIEGMLSTGSMDSSS